ncbi:MAG TPA: CHAT domain-containing protein, partial [Thermoleophilaceae bacterium]
PDPRALAAYRALVDEAMDCFEQALEWRSYERDPGNWAYTQNNYGLAYARRRSDDPVADSRRAIEHYQAAGRGFLAAGDTARYARTLSNVADQQLNIAQRGDLDDATRSALLGDAAQGFVSSIEADGVETSPQEAGRTWRRLADVLVLLDRRAEAISALNRALDGLTPETAPGDCRDAAARLAGLHAEDERWEPAADAGKVAAEAAVAAMTAAATPARRLDEVRASANLFRWSAYAMVRAGRLTEAVETLELGRAREIGARLMRDAHDLDELAAADLELHDRYVSVRGRLDAYESREGWSLDGSLVSAADLAEELQAVLVAIRALPGFERFLASPSFEETLAGLPPDEALVYLITAPGGSVALIVAPALEAERGVAPVESTQLTSTDLRPLFVRPGSTPGRLEGFLPAQERGDHTEITAALTELSAALGPALLAPLAERLERAGVRAVVLVPLTLLGLVPVQAMEWDVEGQPRCLLDSFDVVFAPSGLIRRVCVDRAARRRERPVRLVAVGNPLPASPPLPGAEREAEMVAATLSSELTALLIREDATRDAVVAALPGATHIHFACHGEAAFSSLALDAGLLMAGEERLMAAEFLAMEDFKPRFVAASACETGVIQEYDAVDEAFSLGTALVAAGAAGVVSSLWQISDDATDLLMTRFYETLAGGTEPATALRDAQLWLRGLRRDDAVAFLGKRRRLRSAGTPAPANEGSGGERPYSAPSFWAAFTFTGA